MIFETMVNAREHCGSGEVGIGIGPRDAVFDVSRRRGAGRDAQRYGAIIDSPSRRDRRITIRAEAAIGIAMRRKHQHRVGGRLRHAGDRVAQ